MAVTRFWQALVCGDGRAAYQLFEILRDGEGGVAPNIEMAGMFLFIGRICNDLRCIKTANLKGIPFDAVEAVASVYAKSRDFIAKPDYKITDDILGERQAAANPAMFQRTLISKNVEQVKLAFNIAALISIVIVLLACFIGLVI